MSLAAILHPAGWRAAATLLPESDGKRLWLCRCLAGCCWAVFAEGRLPRSAGGSALPGRRPAFTTKLHAPTETRSSAARGTGELLSGIGLAMPLFAATGETMPRPSTQLSLRAARLCCGVFRTCRCWRQRRERLEKFSMLRATICTHRSSGTRSPRLILRDVGMPVSGRFHRCQAAFDLEDLVPGEAVVPPRAAPCAAGAQLLRHRCEMFRRSCRRLPHASHESAGTVCCRSAVCEAVSIAFFGRCRPQAGGLTPDRNSRRTLLSRDCQRLSVRPSELLFGGDDHGISCASRYTGGKSCAGRINAGVFPACGPSPMKWLTTKEHRSVFAETRSSGVQHHSAAVRRTGTALRWPRGTGVAGAGFRHDAVPPGRCDAISPQIASDELAARSFLNVTVDLLSYTGDYPARRRARR